MEDYQYPGYYESQPVRSDEIYANVLQEERVKNIIGQTSPDNQLIEIEYRIRGYRKTTDNNWEKVDKKAPEPHPLLVSRYIAYLGSILNDNTRFTNYSAAEINKIMRLCIEWLSDDLDTNAEEYGLESSYTERTRIGHILLSTIFTVLKRAENGMESKRIFNALNMNESINQAPQKKGLLEAMKIWK